MNMIKLLWRRWKTRQDELAYQRHKKQYDAEKIEWEPYFELRAKQNAENYARQLKEDKVRDDLAYAVQDSFLIYDSGESFFCKHCGGEILVAVAKSASEAKINLVHQAKYLVTRIFLKWTMVLQNYQQFGKIVERLLS